MIKILKYGQKKEIECGKCGSVLQYEPEDVKKDCIAAKKDFVVANQEYIMCPCCREKVIIKATR